MRRAAVMGMRMRGGCEGGVGVGGAKGKRVEGRRGGMAGVVAVGWQ